LRATGGDFIRLDERLPPRPDLVRPKIETVTPLIPIDTVSDSNTILNPVSASDGALPAAPVATVKGVVGGPGMGFPDTEDYYPAAARRFGEKGLATVQVCVDPAGRLTAAPTIAQSSGSARLDEGALRLARAGSGHYRPTTEDGRAVSSCYPYRIRFRDQGLADSISAPASAISAPRPLRSISAPA
jgi:TonB family protein